MHICFVDISYLQNISAERLQLPVMHVKNQAATCFAQGHGTDAGGAGPPCKSRTDNLAFPSLTSSAQNREIRKMKQTTDIKTIFVHSKYAENLKCDIFSRWKGKTKGKLEIFYAHLNGELGERY